MTSRAAPGRGQGRRVRETDGAGIGATAGWTQCNAKLAAGMLREVASLTIQVTGGIIPSDKPGCVSTAVRHPAGDTGRDITRALDVAHRLDSGICSSTAGRCTTRLKCHSAV